MDSSFNSIDVEAPKMVQVGMLQLPVDISNECNKEMGPDSGLSHHDHHHHHNHREDTAIARTTTMKKVPSMILLGGSSDEEFSTFDFEFPNTKALPTMKKRTPFNLHKRSVSELPQIITSNVPTSRGHRRSYSCDDCDNETISYSKEEEDQQEVFDCLDDIDNAPPRTNFNPPADPFSSDSYAELVAPVFEKSTFGKSGSYVHLADLATEDTTASSSKSSQYYDDILEPISRGTTMNNSKSRQPMNQTFLSPGVGIDFEDHVGKRNDDNKLVGSGKEDEKDVSLQDLLPHPLAGKSMRRCTSSNALEYAVVG